MTTDVHVLDLHHQGHDGVIASFLLPTGGGTFVLIESGPGSTLTALKRGVSDAGYELDGLDGILVTHIHLDHAGGAGELAAEADCPVWVHPVGAPHLVDPERLWSSASRLYDDMEGLWGRMMPLPEERVRTVDDRETVRLGDLELVAHHTPGHAGHHIAWQLGDAVFTGDVGGVRLQGVDFTMPPTPPPEIDLEAWRTSFERLRELSPSTLYPTHFGRFDDAAEQIDGLARRLAVWSEAVRDPVAAGAAPEEVTRVLDRLTEEELGEGEEAEALRLRYEAACPNQLNALGLIRFWKKRQAAAGT